jgi:hypothetical protein
MALAVITANKSNTGMVLDDTILEWAHTVPAGSDRLLLCFVFWKVQLGFPVPAIDSVFFGATEMTAVGNGAHNFSGPDDIWAQAFYLVAPQVVTNDIIVFFNEIEDGVDDIGFEAAFAGAVSLTGAEQSSSAIRGAAVNATWDNNPRINIPSTSDEILFDVFAINDPPGATVGTGQTQLWNNGTAGVVGGAMSFQTGDATGLMDWACTTSQMWCTFAFAVVATGVVAKGPVTDTCKYVIGTETATVDATAVSTPWSAVSAAIGGYAVPVMVNTLRIGRRIGEPATCELSIVNPEHAPHLGDHVQVAWRSVAGTNWEIFNGSVDRFTFKTNNLSTFVTYDVSIVDKSQILTRKKILHVAWSLSGFQFDTVILSIIATHLYVYGDTSFYVAFMDHATTIIPNVTAKLGTSIYELIHDTAAAVGCIFYTVGYGMFFVDQGATTAAMLFTEDTIEEASISEDRDDYRNVQYVRATGTSPSDATTDPVTDLKWAFNDPQITERRLIEGGSGRYEDVTEVVHPTSNDQATISLLAQSVSKILLRTAGAGTNRRLSCRVRDATGRGLQAGEITTIELLRMGVSEAQWVIQSVDIEDEDGRNLIATVEMTETTNKRRALDSWLRIVQKGRVAITAPDQAVNQGQQFTSSGTFVVPGGVSSVLITCFGSGGGGGGAVNLTGASNIVNPAGYNADGGNGGTGGIAFSLIAVTPAESLTVTIGNGGTVGTTGTIQVNLGFQMTGYVAAGQGGTGGTVSVLRGAGVLCTAFGGFGGFPATVTTLSNGLYQHTNKGAQGGAGGGGGDGVSIGGGIPGGWGGVWGRPTGTAPATGLKGSVLIQWFA